MGGQRKMRVKIIKTDEKRGGEEDGGGGDGC